MDYRHATCKNETWAWDIFGSLDCCCVVHSQNRCHAWSAYTVPHAAPVYKKKSCARWLCSDTPHSLSPLLVCKSIQFNQLQIAISHTCVCMLDVVSAKPLMVGITTSYKTLCSAWATLEEGSDIVRHDLAWSCRQEARTLCQTPIVHISLLDGA